MATTRKIRPIAPLSTSRARFGKVGELPRTLRPQKVPALKLSEIEISDPIVTYRRGVRYPKDKQAELEKRAVSKEKVHGSVQERIVYRELQKRRIPFRFQADLFGAYAGRALGGIIVDFELLDRPLVIEVLGTFWHEGRVERAKDAVRNDVIEQRGWQVAELWDWTIESRTLLEEWLRRNVDYHAPRLPRNASFTSLSLQHST